MTQIERREARIRCIRTRNLGNSKLAGYEHLAVDPSTHHCIGKSEHSYEHIGLYVMQRNSDPAVKVNA